jgi:hypothetical protein
LEELREIIRQLGGCPLVSTIPWDNTSWSLEGTIDKIRKLYGQRTDKIFDIASFIISLQNANNVNAVFYGHIKLIKLISNFSFFPSLSLTTSTNTDV